MRASFAVCLAACGVILAAVPVVGHHSFAAEYDANKPINLTGSVTKVEWMNPHAYFYLDVTEPDRKVANWALEMGSPNGLIREGWSRNTLKVGDVVTVEGSAAKDRAHKANARSVMMNGKRLFAASSQGSGQ
ncbi:MAG TPA: DUF6152 family protein [Gemmatimonadaceae bacterium]|nr:DUF6152 family protein [Gemmatimonadaceae bacterium]